MSRVETLEQRVDELEYKLTKLIKSHAALKVRGVKVDKSDLPTLNYKALHRILEDVALVYKGHRLPTNERPQS